MEVIKLTPKSTATQTKQNPFKRFVFCLGDKFNSADCAVDYWLTEKTDKLFSNPSVTNFIDDIETRVAKHRTTHGPSKVDQWFEERFERLISRPFIVSLINDVISAVDESYHTRTGRINQWAKDHGKEPVEGSFFIKVP